MAGTEKKLLTELHESGIYDFPNSLTFFIDPVRILNRNYTQFRVSPSSYYSRFFTSNFTIDELPEHKQENEESFRVSASLGKRKRNQKKKKNQQCYSLNEKELLADQRHQEIRPLLVKAHEELLRAKELLDVICELNCEIDGWERCVDLNSGGINEEDEISFIELGKVWQAPLYEIALDYTQASKQVQVNGGSLDTQHIDQRLLPLFNNLVSNETNYDMVAEFQTSQYILPKDSCFYMSELEQIHTLVPANLECGFNFIMVDPPWENRSAYQKSKYPTLPNRHFLSLPIKQLTHTSGALVALWVTNREKLRKFVENELFPAWGVRYAATLYWLKVKADGSLICDLDLFHHRPYECLLLGYTGKPVTDSELTATAKSLKDQVVMTIPGDYSRKPPVGGISILLFAASTENLLDLLLEYVPGPRPARCIELFAREMMAGWTSWGNEPLHFQDRRYFSRKITENCTNYREL
ncbi:methyltransferase-like protein 2 isoform X1 [Chenopodium quinoa]|uniref:methyltransferase-like protein 2 isoform X1 n=1 Tax=Chenopodium quinoa TaxID=63459 RepID=UPI000B773A14|nr:methyltransferase-like protein 2 isoform X1 [Chenopodium quinoa]